MAAPQFLHRKYVTPILVVILVWLGFQVWKIHDQRNLARNQVTDLESKISDIQSDNQFLASSSAYFSSDAYLERQARLKLNYKMPDEGVAFVYPDTSTKVASASQPIQVGTLPNWKQWWYYLLGQ